MYSCPACRRDISAGTTRCTWCTQEYRFNSYTYPRNKLLAGVYAVVVGFIFSVTALRWLEGLIGLPIDEDWLKIVNDFVVLPVIIYILFKYFSRNKTVWKAESV
jgi:hypothetical protein